MDIVIITNFSSDFSKTDNDRFLYIASLLSKKHNVEIVTSNFCHEKKSHRSLAAESWPFKISFLQEPGYSKNVCLKRFYSHYKWGRNVERYLTKRSKPDVIYSAVPSLSGPSGIAKLCKKQGIRFIIDIQDLWPEAFQMVFNIPIISTLAFFPFKIAANGIYKRADDIVAVSETYLNRGLAVNHKKIKGESVFLGTDLERFDKYAEQNIDVKKNDGEIWLAYCGTLGSSYDLKCVLEALELLQRKGERRIKFIIMGDGPKKKEFEEFAKEKNISSYFAGRIPYDKMCCLLKNCDITVNPIMGRSVASIINKHADYAACGLPVLNTQNSPEYRKLVEQYQMGFNISNGNVRELADKLLTLMNDNVLRMEMGSNARRCAEELFNRRQSYLKIVELIEHNK